MKDLNRIIYRNKRRSLFVISAFAVAPCWARADAGVPMLPVAYPVILIFLVLVILIETVYVGRKLRAAWWRTLGSVAIANTITMVLGYPLMWLLCFIGEIVLFGLLAVAAKPLHLDSIPNTPATRLISIVLGAAWMGPWQGKEYWPVLVAFVVLLVPSFFLSGWFEARVLTSDRWFGGYVGSKSEIWRANILSYVFLAVAGCLLLSYQIEHNLLFTF